MTSGVSSPVSPVKQIDSQLSCCLKLKQLGQIIAQIAVRILFIATSILTAAATFPIHWHAVGLPIVAVSSAFLAAFFFHKITPVFSIFSSSTPLIQPPNLMQPLPADAPRGIVNGGNNCALNALAHFVNSDPLISRWFQTPLSEMDLNTFEQFLAPYRPPAAMTAAFRTFVDNEPHPRPTVSALFSRFLQDGAAYVPAAADQRAFRTIQMDFGGIAATQDAFAQFFAEHNRAIQENRAVIDGSQNLRLALSRAPTAMISSSAQEQVDPSEALSAFFAHLPDAQQMKMEITRRYNVQGRTPLQGNPEGVTQNEETYGIIPFLMPRRGSNEPLDLQKFLNSFCTEVTEITTRNANGINEVYPTTIERQFSQPPTALRFQIQRSCRELVPQGCLARFRNWLTRILPAFLERWLSKCWARPVPVIETVKRDDPVEIPEELTIVVNGAVRTYRLATVINHVGDSPDSGHYTAGRIVNGNKYILDDQRVTLADQATWDDYRRQAYLVCYLPAAP